MVVVWSDEAVLDLKQIYSFIARDSEFYAKKIAESIIAKSEKLAFHPKMGRIVPECDEETIRQFILFSYRIIYQISDDDIYILTVIHQRSVLEGDTLLP